MTNSSDGTLKLIGVLSKVDVDSEEASIANDLASVTQRLMEAPGRAMESMLEGVTSSHRAVRRESIAAVPGRGLQ